MNKTTLCTILLTVGAMLLLFKLATKMHWIGNGKSNYNNNKSYEPNNNVKYNKPKRKNTDNNTENKAENNTNDNTIAHNDAEVKNLHLFDHDRKLILTKHAKCRMECRHFTEAEVQEILHNGEVNFRKSNDRKGDCPTYALEGKTSDGQQARMVFALCDYNTAKVITVIDLDTDWQCTCY